MPAIYRNKQFSQELQRLLTGPMQGVAGAYYLNARAQDFFDVRLYTTSPTAAPGFTQGTTRRHWDQDLGDFRRLYL